MTDCAWRKGGVIPQDVAKADNGKAKISLCPIKIFTAIARVREYGLNKYPRGGKYNWKEVDIERYVDAFMRHALAVCEDVYSEDAESGLPHIWHCACNIAFIIELMEDVPEVVIPITRMEDELKRVDGKFAMSKEEFENLKKY